MYPGEGTSRRSLLQASRPFLFREPTVEEVDLEDVAVDNPSSASETSKLSEVVPKGKRRCSKSLRDQH